MRGGLYQTGYDCTVATRAGGRTLGGVMKHTNLLLRPATALALAVLALVLCVPAAEARGGKDDPAGQQAGDDSKRGRGGQDDPANHDLGDDRGGARNRDDRGGADDPAGDDHGGLRDGGGSGRGGFDDPANHDLGDDRGGDRKRGGKGRGGRDDLPGHT